MRTRERRRKKRNHFNCVIWSHSLGSASFLFFFFFFYYCYSPKKSWVCCFGTRLVLYFIVCSCQQQPNTTATWKKKKKKLYIPPLWATARAGPCHKSVSRATRLYCPLALSVSCKKNKIDPSYKYKIDPHQYIIIRVSEWVRWRVTGGALLLIDRKAPIVSSPCV